MRIVVSIVMAIVLMNAPARAGEESLAGEWAGGTDVLSGWRFTQLRFAADGQGDGWSGSIDLPSGDVMRLPLDGIRHDGGQVRFRVSSPYGMYSFTGALQGDRLQGEVVSPTGKASRLHALRARPELAEDRAALAGAYRLSKGLRLILTTRPFGQLAGAVVEEGGGGTRIERAFNLIPIGADRYLTSGSVVKALAADERIEFVRDRAGRVASARWTAPDGKTTDAPRVPDEAEQEPVLFASGALTLEGTLWRPRDGGPFPAIVLVHGSGPVTRDLLFLRARELARRGFAVLAYDKRGTGRGEASWQAATFSDLAGDAVAAVDLVRRHPRVDSGRVGLQGNSQAGWIIPIAAARAAEVAFAIVVSGGGVGPAEQEIFRARTQTARRGFTAADADAAAGFIERKRDYAFTGAGWEAYAAAAKDAAAQPWFDFVNGPLVPEPAFWSDWRSYKDYDPRAWIGKVRQPVLVLLGKDDDSMPVAEAARVWEETLRAAGHADFSVRILPGFGHGLFSRETKDGVVLVPETFGAVVDWLTPRLRGMEKRTAAR